MATGVGRGGIFLTLFNIADHENPLISARISEISLRPYKPN